MKDKFRPSHADYTYFAKFGIRAWQGGGRCQRARNDRPRRRWRDCQEDFARKIRRGSARLRQAGPDALSADVNPDKVKLPDVESNIVRCPDAKAAEKMIRLIEKMRREGNTVGGIVEGVARGVPAGWGEPVFDKLEADLAKAMLSLPASKAFEVGSGFGGILLTGREHNDAIPRESGKVFTTTNRSGGIQGGISNGETIFFRVAFKPVATVMHEQDTVDVTLAKHDAQGPRTARSVRAAARRADGGGDDGAGAGGSRAAATRAMWLTFARIYKKFYHKFMSEKNSNEMSRDARGIIPKSQ